MGHACTFGHQRTFAIRNMRKNTRHLIAVLLTFGFCATVSAQENRQAAYEKSIDFVKCKCIEVIYGISLTCEADPATARVEQYAARHPRTGSLIGELERLKQKSAETLPTDSISHLLGTAIFDEANQSTYPQIYNFSVNRGRNTDGTLTTLQTAIVSYVAQHVPAVIDTTAQPALTDSLVETVQPVAPLPATTGVNDERNATPSSTDSFFSFRVNVGHLLLAGLAILVGWLFVNRLRRDHEEQLRDLQFRLEGKADAVQLDKVETELRHFEEKLAAARRKRLAEQKARAGARSEGKAPAAAASPLRVEKILYLPAPNADGSFRVADESTQFRPAVSVYKFKIDPDNPDLATFSFHSDNIGLQHAIGHPATYIRPVCQETNPAHPGAKYVATDAPGIAQKKGNTWVVAPQQKARIRYE